MPTKPFEPLLYRGFQKVAAKEIIDIASKKVLGKFRPGEERSYGRWYVTEVRDRYRSLRSDD